MPRTVLDELITIIGFRGDTRELDRVKRRIADVDRAINTVARNFAIAGAALTGVGFVVGRTVLSFDRAMNTLRATLLDAPVDKLQELRDQAQQLGAETSKSATDAANAQVELARAGLDVEQVLEAIPDVLNLAIAGELEMGEAAGLATNQLAAFKLETSETERVVDVLAKTAVSARTTVGELGPAFRQVAPLAADLGIEIEQVAAVIGTLRTGGLIPEQAGTAFRNIVAILQEDPTAKVSEGFQRLGLDFDNIRAMVSAGDIEGAFKRIGEAGLDTRTALQIFGREAAVGASILAGRVADLDDFISHLEAAGGTAVEMRSVIEGGLPGSVDQFRSSLESLQLELGDSGLRGLMIKVLDTIRDFLRWITNAPGPLKTLSVAAIAAGPVLLGLAAGLKAVSFALGGLAPLLKLARGAVWLWRNALILTRIQMVLLSVQTQLSSLATWLNTAATNALSLAFWRNVASQVASRIAMIAGTAATIAATVATAAFGVALTIATGPIGLVILAIAGLIAGLVLAVKHWDTVKRVVLDVWGSVVESMQNAWARIKGFFDRFGNYILAALAVAIPFIGIPLLIARNWGRIVGVVRGVWNTIVGIFRDHWAKILAVLFPPVGIPLLIARNWGRIVEVVRGVWDSVVGIFRDHWAKILAVLFPPVGLPVLIARNWGQIVEIVGGIWNRVYDTVKGWIDAIISFIRELPGRVREAVADLPSIVGEAVKDIPVVGQVVDVAGGLADKAKGFLGGIGKALGFAEGGIVPGPLGRPLLATVHGGEMVVPPGALGTLSQMLNGFAAGAAALPTAPAGAGTIYRSSVTNRTTKVEITGPITIHTQATDAREIAQQLSHEIEDQFRNIAYDQDGPIDR